MNKKHILTHDGIEWYLCDNGQLCGDCGNSDHYRYKFWIGNPPSLESPHYQIFVAVCNFAATMGLLRPIHVYTAA